MISQVAAKLDECFQPRNVAVVGASNTEMSMGAMFIQFMVKSGFQGEIYPVHPKGEAVHERTGYRDLLDVPGDIDYVISCVPANLVLDMLRKCKQKNVKMVHLFTARMSETGEEKGAQLEKEVLAEARRLGIPLIGPNCMGLYNPRVGIAFGCDAPREVGNVGLISQSGGAAQSYIRACALKGIRFTKGISYGNATDINECDYLEYFANDPETKIINMYIEGVRDGRRFFKLLKEVTPIKPVIILKGGKSKAGTRSTASHTGSIAGSTNAWDVVYRQSNAIKAADMDDMVNITTAFNYLPPITGNKVGIYGGSGGKTVLSADECEQCGLDVIPMPEDVRDFVGQKEPFLREWIGNPIDMSIFGGFNVTSFEVLEATMRSPAFDLIIYNVMEEYPHEGEMAIQHVILENEEFMKIAARNRQKPILVNLPNPEVPYDQVDHWRNKAIFKLRESLATTGLPVFSSARAAATAAQKLIEYYQRKSR
ncbi:MAG: CoA-binding protein [Bacillota bacterium]